MGKNVTCIKTGSMFEEDFTMLYRKCWGKLFIYFDFIQLYFSRKL